MKKTKEQIRQERFVFTQNSLFKTNYDRRKEKCQKREQEK